MNPWKWNSKASWELEVAWEVCKDYGAQIWCGNKWYTIFNSPWHRQKVQTNSSAYWLSEVSLSDWNVLQWGDHVSTEEHGVRDCQKSEHRFIWGGIVNHQDQGFTGGLADCQGVLWNEILLKLRPDVRMEPFSIHDERSMEDWDCRVVAWRDDASCLEVNPGQ